MTRTHPLEVPARRRLPTWGRVALALAILGGTVWFLIVPQRKDAQDSLTAMARLSALPVIAAFGLELLSLFSYSGLSATVLGRGRLPYRTLLGIDMADLAVNHTAPGGGTTAGAVRIRLLMSEGVTAREALVAATLQISISNLVLVALFVLGLVLALAQSQDLPGNGLLALLLALIAVGGVAVSVWALTARTRRVNAAARSIGRRIPLIGEARLSRLVLALTAGLRRLGRDPRRLGQAAAFAGGGWILDAASLWVMLASFGSPIQAGPLLTVYGVGCILAVLPLTPGGLGIVEGVMVPALIGFGVPHTHALLGVIGWRLFEYWFPIPAGSVAYAGLVLARHLRHRRRIDPR